MLLMWIILSATIGHVWAWQLNGQEGNSTSNSVNITLVNFDLFEIDNIHAEIHWLLLDMIGKMHPGHCYALIFDTVYETVFSSQLFQSVSAAARFIIKISQDEDTLDPRPETRCILENVRRAGCGGYVIMLANGIQMDRLLRFGDKTRIIDTRARFIMLHDYRLFVPKLHYLWKRFINVVFVRRMQQKMANVNGLSQSSNSAKPTLYELSTVPFPIPIKGVFFTKIINFWQSGKFRFKNDILFGDKTADLGGQTMQVVVLEHTPAVFKSNPDINIKSNRIRYYNNNTTDYQSTRYYYGVEVELLKAISKAMHFKMNFYETHDADQERWGMMTPNGTLTGLLRDMDEGRADFALADLHHTEYHLGFMDLSIPYNTECLTFLTPEALRDNSWKTLIMPFNGTMWAGVLTTLFSVGFVFYAFSATLVHMRQQESSYRPEHDLLQHRRKHKIKSSPSSNLPKRVPKLNRLKSKLLDRMIPTILRKKIRKKRIFLTIKSSELNFYRTHPKLQKLRMISFKRKPEPWHEPLPRKDIFDSFSGCIIYTYSMLLLVSLPRVPKGWPLRVLTGWYWIYCVLVVVAYRASFTAILANPIPRLTIDTLQDLAESPIRCGAWGEQNILFFQTANDPHSHIIGAKLEHAPNPQKAVEQVVKGMYAYYENIYLLRQLRSVQKSEKARQTLHIMKQCVVNIPISIGLEKNSPIQPQVNRYVRALIEGGLTGKWLSDAIERFQSNVELPPQEATINLTKMYAGILAVILGYGISSIAFVIEKLWWAYFVESSPTYDKYLLGIKFRKRG